MFCPKCGTPNDEGSKFCANCGAALVANTINNNPATGNPVNGSFTGTTGMSGNPVNSGFAGTNGTSGNPVNGGFAGTNGMGGNPVNGGFAGTNGMGGNPVNGGFAGTSGTGGNPVNGGFAGTNRTGAGSIQKKISKRTWIIAAEIVAIIVLVFVFQMNARKECSPESVAERYFQTYTQGDLKDVYKYIDAGEGNFLCEDTFESAVNLDDNAIRGDVSNYSVFVKQNDGYRATVQVTYQTKSDGNSDQTMSLTLNKTGNKKFLFFDEWAVSNSFSTVSNGLICVPKGSKVTLDGIDVTKKAKAENRDDGMTHYTIDKIYAGNHVIEVEADGFQSVKDKVEFTDDDTHYTADLTLTEDVVKRIAGEAVDNNKRFIEDAVKQESVTSVVSLMNPMDRSGVNSDYDEFKEYLQDSWWNPDTFSYEDTSVSKAVLSDVSVSYEAGSTNGDDDYDYINAEDTILVGCVTITEHMKGSYSQSDLSDRNAFITQKYYYGIKDGGISLYSVSTSHETQYE